MTTNSFTNIKQSVFAKETQIPLGILTTGTDLSGNHFPEKKKLEFCLTGFMVNEQMTKCTV